MPSTYHMVLINLAATALFGIAVLTYRLVYPKRKFNYFIIFFLFSLLPLISIFRNGVYESGDFNYNIYKSMSLAATLADGSFPAAWARDLNATYGYPLFLFTYPLPYYIVVFVHSLGLSFIVSLKVFLALSFLASGALMFAWLKKQLGELSAFVGSIFYLFAPYHLIDLHYRVAIGEVLSFVFLPLNFLCVFQMTKTNKKRWYILESLALAALILSHQAISLAASPFIFFYFLLLWQSKRNRKQLFIGLFSFVLGLCLSSFYWLPVLIESKFALQYFNATIVFPKFWEFFYSPWRYGFLFQGPLGQLSFVLGYTQWLIVFLSVYLFFKKKVNKQTKLLFLFSLISFFIIFFMMNTISKPLWYLFPILLNFQFSYRLLVLAVFFVSILGAIITKVYNNKPFLLIIVLLAVIPTVLNWGNRRVISTITDQTLQNNLPYSTSQGEGLWPAKPLWTNPKISWMSQIPQSHLEVLEGSANLKELKRKTTLHSYFVSTSTNVLLKENTWYFPGWKVFDNGKPVPVKFLKAHPGIIAFSLSNGEHNISVVFDQTPDRTIGKFLSLLSLTVVFIVLLSRRIKLRLLP
ncbi:MAG TPA: 6-pyruvoyl-tetrahydropterin synthase-related protein [Candidatus Saccharimonadales bacterium]|nr:6-pyruvoyl-tetrahydropterin synthase-related protein [Candidatus Saccharimonadales bacterium]